MGIFHRYDSTMHGNFRRVYLRCGALTGILLAAYVMVRLLMGSPMPTATGYVSDAIVLVAVFLFTAFYRNSLPDKKITLKEAMLLGIGVAVVASVIYALALWATGNAFPEQTVLFTRNMMGKEIIAQDPQLNYWAILWALVALVETAVIGGFGAFLAAIVLRNEKAPVHQKRNKENK